MCNMEWASSEKSGETTRVVKDPLRWGALQLTCIGSPLQGVDKLSRVN